MAKISWFTLDYPLFDCQQSPFSTLFDKSEDKRSELSPFSKYLAVGEAAPKASAFS